MENIVGYRIKSARKLKGLSLQNVADELGVSKQMVSKYENGVSIPPSSKLLSLSKLFDQKVDYFFRSFKIELGEVNFRKKSSFSAKKENSLKEQIKIKLENYLWIESVLGIDSSFNNIISNKTINSILDIEAVVLSLRNSWSIGVDPIYNIIQLLEDKEIKIIEIYDADDKFDGLATYIDNKYPVIVVNGNFPVERKRFTLLHELGHLLLQIPRCELAEEEKFCHRFASEFLLPRKMLINEFGGKRKHISFTELVSIQKKYGISIPAIIYRLVELGVLPKEYHKQFYKKINFNPSLKKTIYHSRFQTPEKSFRFKQLVYRALAQEDISMSKASSLLNKSIESIKENYALI
ncbi:helix-turn-helix domain-containing protein [Aureispira sp. CCB-QB1]|uniref:helix-turn-helix domain-containing protein n=1 Tax=Aureispira sp. CCB-QB1 TaxID=1313421 RepID=UPI00069712EF|nr:helix-turn-helix domain-containing protein [Aureispira sp. CCB-QB1]